MYKIIQQASSFQVVFAIDGGTKVVRVLDTFSSRGEAERLMGSLSGWRF
jgi:hypothetical protein